MQPVTPVIQVFDTVPLPVALRFEGFRSRIDTMFDMMPLNRADERDFSGVIRSINLGSLIVSSMRTAEFAFARPRPRLLRDFLDHLMVRVDLDGAPEAGGKALGITLIDLGRVTDHGITPRHNISVVVPRHLPGLTDAHLLQFHGVRLQGPMAMVLADHVVSLMRHGGAIGPAETAAMNALTPAMLAACLQPTQETISQARADLDVAIVLRARAHIEQHLRFAGLDPASVARAAGVSRATLYRLFEPVGGVARAIREARLKQAMRDIARGGAGAKLGDIGHELCFSSEAQFSRAFKAHFGISPREARSEIREGRIALARDVHAIGTEAPIFKRWLATL